MNDGEVGPDRAPLVGVEPAPAVPPGVAPKAIAAPAADDERKPADPGKEALELQKLALEIKSLSFKQSHGGRVIELLQGIVPVLAILTLVWTVFMGLGQQEAQRRDAESARFERAYTKLGSGLPSERATGVAQASSLLHLAGGARDKDILTALANQLALDEDVAVRSAILNVFANLDQATSRDALDVALKNIVDLHRVIVQSSGATPFELATAMPDLRGIYFIPGQADDRANDATVDRRALHDMFTRLASLRGALLSMLKAGARTQTLDHIYCPVCDFAALGIDLSNTSFEGAILPRTQWRGVRLDRASFRNAVIEQANFTGAQLEGADFSGDEQNMNRQAYVSATALSHVNPALRPGLYLYEHATGAPTFVCANLRSANFRNFAVVTRLDEGPLREAPKPAPPKPPGAITVTSTSLGQRESWPLPFRGASIAGADFSEVQEIILRPLDPQRADPYAAIHEVRTPPGYPYRYYAQSMPLSYLKFYQPGRSAEADRERDRNVEALAMSFVEAEGYEEAKLPPGVLESVREERGKRRFQFAGCAAYLNAGRSPSASAPAARP
jgi:uncharacterized protein YjbI with pentapeptide repeats